MHREALGAPGADAVDDVVTLRPLRNQSGNRLGRILQIAIHQHDGVAEGLPQAGSEGHLGTEVARVRDHGDARIGGGDFEEQLLGVVGAGVVDEDDLVVRS